MKRYQVAPFGAVNANPAFRDKMSRICQTRYSDSRPVDD